MSGGNTKTRRLAGYTIVEVMIFLAVSGLMFVTAATFINGKQANAEFKQGMDDANSQIRSTMNDVINGFYPSASTFSCTAPSPGGTLNIFTGGGSGGGGTQQGQNQGCVFAGKVLQFGVTGGTNGITTSAGYLGYNVFSVAARQYANNNRNQLPPTSFQEAVPAAIDNGQVNVTDQKMFHWGTAVTAVYCLNAGCSIPRPGAIGFFSSFGNFSSGSSGTLQSGSQSVNVVLIPSSKLGQDEATTAGFINQLGTTNPAPLADPDILVCFLGSNGKKASITIGGQNGQQLTTSIRMADPRC